MAATDVPIAADAEVQADAADVEAAAEAVMADDAAMDGAVVNGDFTIDRCSSCSTKISLRSPTPDSPASAWLCRRCGSVFFARCQEKDGKPFSAGTRLVSYHEVMKAINVHIEGQLNPVSQKDVQRLVQCLAAKTHAGPEIRKQQRFPVAAPVTVVPLSADLRVAGQAARVMTINISGGGAALVHSRRIIEPYLAIDFAASGVDLLPVVMQVSRVRALAAAFEVAGRFVCRILQ